ncbi:ABC transporter ATP-binding protein [Psychromonas sp. SR45-3]|uniref:ABC transporter ATP-binding protein n=1 Tax=Psychromonas sp. SR45-3 TaxID=2760930 RepID=UPI0015FC53BA|nr:ATP-binding cassette domain-containing protein [Psychromonas sp. SR45-3]MBB1272489.1 ATP-binding cassette domain-containing protein [Psychromonas sp. SR45-3]
MNNKKTVLTVNNVTFSYDDKVVLKDFSLNIDTGSFVCLTGESGCGKSTLLRLMNGLLIPQQGDININGEQLTLANAIDKRRSIGYILQEGALFPHLTVYQNMIYCLTLLNMSPQACQQRIDELLPLVNLSHDLLQQFPDQLSGGQRQRVGIIRGIAHHPAIVLMDEPFSALDPETRESLQDLVKSIHQQTDTTFVMVTHSLSEAEKLGTAIVNM